MNKLIKSFSILGLAFLVSGCDWQVPKSVTVETDATYRFQVGSVNKSLKEELSAKNISEKINSNSEASSTTKNSNYELNIYDYTGESTENRELLADITFGKMEFDISKLLPSDLDFENAFSGSSGTQIQSQEITIPDLTSSINENTMQIELGDFSKEIPQKIQFEDTTVPIPDTTISISESDAQSAALLKPIDIKVKTEDGTFESMTFASGSALEITLTPPTSGNIQSGFSAEIGCILYNVNGEAKTQVTKSEQKSLSTTGATTISIPLDDKTLGKSISVGFFGQITGSGTAGTGGTGTPQTYSYSVKSKFTDTTSISKISGATMDFSGDENSSLKFEKKIAKTENSPFVECTIGEGTLNISCEKPNGWSGITFTPEITVSGGLSASNSDWTDAANSANYVMNKNLSLANKKYKNEDITISGKIKVKLENAEITFSDATKSLSVKPNCSISKINSAVANLKDVISKLDYNIEYDLNTKDSSVSDYVESITLESGTGIRIPYTNTLPEGNDISVKYYSSFLKIGDSTNQKTETMTSFGDEKESDGTEKQGTMNFLSESEQTVTLSTNSKIDFTVKLELPKTDLPTEYTTSSSSADKDFYTVLKDIELGKTYRLNIGNPESVFKWKEAKVKTDKIDTSFTQTIDTGLDMSSVLSSVTDSLGDSEFLKSISISKVPMYLYVAKPEINAFKDLSLQGKIVAKTTDTATSSTNRQVVLMGKEESGTVTEEELETVSVFPVLDTDENLEKNLVTKAIDEKSASVYKDIKELFDTTQSGNLSLDYAIKVKSGTSGSSNTVTVTREEFENLQKSESGAATSVGVHARIVIPLEFEINPKDASGNETENLEIDIKEMIKKSSDSGSSGSGTSEPLTDKEKDLFSRDSATDLSSIEKYLSLIESASIDYEISNELLRYTDGSKNFTVKMNSKIAEIGTKTFSVGNGNLKVTTDEVQKMMETYPFEPELKIVLPKGNIVVPTESAVSVSAALKVKTKGEIQLDDFWKNAEVQGE